MLARVVAIAIDHAFFQSLGSMANIHSDPQPLLGKNSICPVFIEIRC